MNRFYCKQCSWFDSCVVKLDDKDNFDFKCIKNTHFTPLWGKISNDINKINNDIKSEYKKVNCWQRNIIYTEYVSNFRNLGFNIEYYCNNKKWKVFERRTEDGFIPAWTNSLYRVTDHDDFIKFGNNSFLRKVKYLNL